MASNTIFVPALNEHLTAEQIVVRFKELDHRIAAFRHDPVSVGQLFGIMETARSNGITLPELSEETLAHEGE